MSAAESGMQRLPDYYEDLGVDQDATAEEIERVYRKRSGELRASQVEDAPEELAEVEAAYTVLCEPTQRAKYDTQLRQKEQKLEAKYRELDKLTSASRHHVRRFDKGSSGWLDAIWALLARMNR